MVGRYWDRGLIEIMGPLGLQRLFHSFTFKLELLATGLLPHYALLLLTFSWLTMIYFWGAVLALGSYLPTAGKNKWDNALGTYFTLNLQGLHIISLTGALMLLLVGVLQPKRSSD